MFDCSQVVLSWGRRNVHHAINNYCVELNYRERCQQKCKQKRFLPVLSIHVNDMSSSGNAFACVNPPFYFWRRISPRWQTMQPYVADMTFHREHLTTDSWKITSGERLWHPMSSMLKVPELLPITFWLSITKCYWWPNISCVH